MLKIGVSYDFYIWGKSQGTRYDYLCFADILVNVDGTVSLAYDDHLEHPKTIDNDCYDVTKIE